MGRASHRRPPGSLFWQFEDVAGLGGGVTKRGSRRGAADCYVLADRRHWSTRIHLPMKIKYDVGAP